MPADLRPAISERTPPNRRTGDESLDALASLEAVTRRFSDDRLLVRHGGRIVELTQTSYRARGLSATARVGDLVEHRSSSTLGRRLGEIVKVERDEVLVAPYGHASEAGIGDRVTTRGPFRMAPDRGWRGRVVNALAMPVDDAGPLRDGATRSASTETPPAAMSRQRVGQGFVTGVRVVDVFAPLCFGQRLGVFAGSGVGKSTLLAMLASADAFDTVVVALVGERGREVREFLEDTIGASAMAKTVAIVATGDEPAMMRRRAPLTAMRIAEHFRDAGDRVLLILDSITRYAHALREVAAGAGEPPVARGYPASVFTELPKLLERAGPGAEGTGSITAIISVLVDGDDHNDPVADAVRGILDGHIVLDRAIAEAGRYPAVNPFASLSRLAPHAWTPDQRALVVRLKAMIARFEDTRDIRLLGAYQPGLDAELDTAVKQVPALYEALVQAPSDGPAADPFGDIARRLRKGDKPNG